jgi:UDP-N-acetyl-D-glucosamine dehydrogenase
MKITVVGMGKIGLPLAVQFARKGHKVIGTDINTETVDLINAGREPFPNETHLAEYLPVEVSAGRLTATTNTPDAVHESDAVVVVVPLFVDKDANPDFSAMDAATHDVAQGLVRGTLVSYETTLPVGTTRNRLVPVLEEGSGLVAGEDFFVVFSPERVLTGRVFFDLRRYPKLVGGISSDCERRGVDFYENVLDFDDRSDLPRPNGVWSMGSTEAAEFAKLAETTYRDVNIGLANQFALFAEQKGIDIANVIEACNSQPYSHIHTPGIAVGGHCIPVYPRLYLWNDPEASIVEAARLANATMPSRQIDRVHSALGSLNGLRVAVLGAAYRGGVKATDFSGIFATVDRLVECGATPLVHDPLYSTDELQELGFDTYEKGQAVDVVVVQADHAEYREWGASDCPGVRLVLDGRSILDRNRWEPACRLLRIGA